MRCEADVEEGGSNREPRIDPSSLLPTHLIPALDMTSVLDGSTSSADVQRWQQKYLEEMRTGAASNDTRYEFAKCIVKSRDASPADLERSVVLLEDLCASDHHEKRKDYLFCLAIAYTKLGNYFRAEVCVKKCMVLEPGNRQTHELQDIIHSKLQRERMTEAAVAGGTAVLIGGLVGLGMALASRR